MENRISPWLEPYSYEMGEMFKNELLKYNR